jgi:hypothetical protein
LSKIASERFCSFVKGGKASLALGKEGADTIDAVIAHHRRDISEDDQSDAIGVARASDERGLSAPRSANKRNRMVELEKEPLDVATVCLEQVISIARPAAVAVTAQVERNAIVASLGNLAGRASPRAAALSSAMKKEDGRGRRITKGFSGKLQPIPLEASQ